MMKRVQLGKSDLQAPNIALGCMGMWKLSVKEAEKVIHHALELGIDFLTTRIFMAGKIRRNFCRSDWFEFFHS